MRLPAVVYTAVLFGSLICANNLIAQCQSNAPAAPAIPAVYFLPEEVEYQLGTHRQAREQRAKEGWVLQGVVYLNQPGKFKGFWSYTNWGERIDALICYNSWQDAQTARKLNDVKQEVDATRTEVITALQTTLSADALAAKVAVAMDARYADRIAKLEARIQALENEVEGLK